MVVRLKDLNTDEQRPRGVVRLSELQSSPQVAPTAPNLPDENKQRLMSSIARGKAETKQKQREQKEANKKKASSLPAIVRRTGEFAKKLDEATLGKWIGDNGKMGQGDGRSLGQKLGDHFDRTAIDIPGTKIDNAVGNFVQGAGDTATFGLSTWLNRQMDRQEVADGATETTAGKVGQVAGTLLPGGVAWRAGTAVTRGIGNPILRTAARGAVGGALYGAGRELGEEGFDVNDESLQRRALDVALDTGLGAGGDLAIAGIGRGIRAIRQRPLTREINNFIDRTQKPAEAPAPRAAIVRQSGSEAADPGAELAGNFRRFDKIQKQFDDAVETQYQYLKQSMKDRGGVQQGGLVRDQAGDVVGRYGRQSVNPRWYRDFFAENGRAPRDRDLRELARKHVTEGYADDAGQIPAWRAPDIEDIDGELTAIRSALQRTDDQAERTALQEVADTLAISRQQVGRQLPEGVQARSAKPGGGSAASGGGVPGPGAPPPSPPAPPAGPPGVPPGPAATPAKTISRTELVENIRKKLGVTIDTGRMGVSKQKVAGIYKTQPEVIRTGTQGDYDTIAHEVGHHFTKRFDLKRVPSLERELTDMMDTMNVHDYRAYPQSEWFDEGIAEYFRAYLADPAQARQLAPQFSAFLESSLPKSVRKGLVSVQRDIDTWIKQGEYAQAKGMLDFDSGSRKEGFTWSKWYTKFVDDLHPLEMLEKALTGSVAAGKKSIYKMARLSRGVAERSKMAVTRGIYDESGNKLSDGLAKIIRPLEQVGMKESDLATYLAVKHAADLKKMGKEVPFSDAQIRSVLQRWDSDPTVRQVHGEIMTYNNALLKILEDAGIVSAKSVQEMKQKYPNYVPFFRHFDDDTIAGFRSGGGYGGSAGAFANITTPIRKMTEEGSDRTLINPVESMVKNTFLAMAAASKNKVGIQLADLAGVEGAGAWVEHVPGQKSAREHIVDVYINGKKLAYKIRDPELYNAMLSLDTESTNSLIRFLGGAASMLRAGATLTPEFMIRNAFRDVAGATVTGGKYGFNPVDFFKGFFHVVTKSSTFDQFMNSGGAMSTMMALDRDASREAMEAVFRKSLKDKTLNVVTSPKEMALWLSLVRPVQGTVSLLRKGSEVSELSTKVGAFSKALRKSGSAEEAAYTARDLMDFNRAGSSIRQANRAVAFLNASIQGTDKMVRAFKENPAGFLTRAFTTLVLPAAGIYFWNKYNLSDKERAAYENIPQYQKDTFYVIGIPGTGEFVRIPKPFEAGMLFATSTERMLRWLEDNDPDGFKGYARATLESVTPPMLFTALTPLLEGMTNYSFFRKAPIVPRGEELLQKKDQYGVFTSEVAKDVGKGLDRVGLGNSNFASPRIIDNTIQGYSAGLGGYAIDAADALIKRATGRKTTPLPAKKPTEYPVARSFFASTAGGGQARDEFYKAWNKLNKAKESAEFNEVQFENLPEYNRMKTYQKAISKLQKRYKVVQKSDSLTPQEKRSMLDELDAKMNEYAKDALEK